MIAPTWLEGLIEISVLKECPEIFSSFPAEEIDNRKPREYEKVATGLEQAPAAAGVQLQA